MKTLGVGAVFSASHSHDGGPVHGHSYEVIAWFECPIDGDAAQAALKELVSHFDHTDISWLGRSEDIAEYIGNEMSVSDGSIIKSWPVKVEVNRPLERVFGVWER